MSGNKNLRKQLKGPDAFQIQMARVLDKLLASRKTLIALVVVCVVAVAGTTLSKRFMGQEVEKRRDELSAIDIVYTGELKVVETKREDLQKQVDALRILIKPPVVDPAKKDQKEPPKNPNEDKIKEDIKQLEAKMTDITPDHSGSAVQYQKFYDKYPNHPEGWAAGMRYVA